MPVLRLRPWPFKKDEKVRLYWLCSPYKSANGNWLIRAFFLSEGSSEFKTLEYPWGTLPALRIGRIYTDGLFDRSRYDEQSGNVFTPNFQNGSTCKAFDLPKSLYNFYQNPTLGRERLWTFRADRTVYYIPCLELVRAFLATSKTFANQILKPHGLDSLIEEENLQDDTLTILLSKIIPITLVNDRTVAHLVWLYYENTARECWESVHRNLFAEAIQLSPAQPALKFAEGIPLSIKPPLNGSCELSFRGVFYKHFCLIVEILRVKGFPNLPFEKIIYTHPALKKKASGVSPGTIRRFAPKETPGPVELDTTGRPARNESYQPLADTHETTIEFNYLPSFIRETVDTVPVRDEVTVTETEGKPFIKKGENTVSTSEPYYGGEIRPVEFIGLYLTLADNINGLEHFLTAIRYIVAGYSQPSVRYSVVELPGERSFCRLPDGSSRNCAVVEINQDGVRPSFILEIARPDGRFISTLLIQVQANRTITASIEKEIASLLEDTVRRDGHWNVERLEQSSTLQVIRLTHVRDQSSWDWSQRILRRLILFGFTPNE